MLKCFVTKRRDKKTALKLLRKSLTRHGWTETIVTDRLASYEAALKALGAIDKRETGRWMNNRAEDSHQPFRRRERAMLRFRRMRSLQQFATVHGFIHNHFNQERTLASRTIFKDRRATALAEWRQLCMVDFAGQGAFRGLFGLSVSTVAPVSLLASAKIF